MENKRAIAGGTALAALGLVLAVVAVGWLRGTLGVSAITASGIVASVEVGSFATFLIAIAATGGLVGAALWGTLRLLLATAGRAAVIA